MLTIRIMRWYVLAAFGLFMLLVGASSSAYAAETADWLPLKGTYNKAVGCTWEPNGCGLFAHTNGKKGIDFMVGNNAPVYAAGPGKIVRSYNSCNPTNSPNCNGKAGNWVVIAHPDGRQSEYLHLSRVVKGSGSVSRGTLIGYSGASGLDSGIPAHLHYDERIGGSLVDPGPMKAVHGGSLKQYPNALGYSSWNSVPAHGNHTLRNDSFKPSPPPPTSKRIGVLNGNDNLYVKEGGVDAPWVLMMTNVRDFRLEGDRIAALTTGGKLFAKEGSLDARWSAMSSGGVAEFEITNDRLGIRNRNGRLYVKEGPLNARWKLLSTGVKGFELSPKRVAVLNTRNNLQVKEGSLDARWVLLATGVAGFDVTDKRVGFRNGNDVLYVKDGTLSASWVRIMNQADEFKLKDDRIAVLDRDKTLMAKEGGLSAQWVTLTSASDFDITADRVSVLQGNQVSVKEGALNASWVKVATGIVEHDLS